MKKDIVKKIAVIAVVSAAAALSILFVVRGRNRSEPGSRKKPVRDTRHGEGIDRAHGPLLAAMKAPEGKNPCESAYNSLKAFTEAPNPGGFPRPFGKLPERKVFMERCLRLSEKEQICIQPRYTIENPEKREECIELLAPLLNSTRLFDTLPETPPGSESGDPDGQ